MGCTAEISYKKNRMITDDNPHDLQVRYLLSSKKTYRFRSGSPAMPLELMQCWEQPVKVWIVDRREDLFNTTSEKKI